MPTDAEPEPPRVPWLLVVGVALLAAIGAVAQLGRIHPDEVYQALEPAYARAFGYGILAWEWQVGLRNWAVPLFLSLFLRAAAALGLRDPLALRAAVELPQAALHVAALAAAYRYAARRVGPKAALWAVPLVGLYGPVLTFAGRTLGESVSAAFLVVGLELLDRPAARARAYALGGACLGLAVVARYGSAAVVVAALVWLAAARRGRALAFSTLAGLAVALALGGLDWATWGHPFHSLRAYLDFNLFSGAAAAQFGREPDSFYAGVLARGLAPWAWPGLAFAAWKQAPRVSLLLTCGVAYLGAITAAAHKEPRFIYPALFLLAVAAAPGALGLLARVHRADLRAGLAAALLAVSLAPLAYTPDLAVQRGDQFRALVHASRGATGLLVVNEGLWGAGGYFYLGKQIPWAVCDFPYDAAFRAALAEPLVNRVVTYDGRGLDALVAGGFRVVEQIDRATVLARGP